MDTKLKPIYKEYTFWVILMISLPGIVALYMEAFMAIQDRSFDAESFYVAALASPIVLYLGVGRQYARGKAVEAAPKMEAALNAHPVVPLNELEGHEVDTAPDIRADFRDVAAEAIDAEAEAHHTEGDDA